MVQTQHKLLWLPGIDLSGFASQFANQNSLAAIRFSFFIAQNCDALAMQTSMYKDHSVLFVCSLHATVSLLYTLLTRE